MLSYRTLSIGFFLNQLNQRSFDRVAHLETVFPRNLMKLRIVRANKILGTIDKNYNTSLSMIHDAPDQSSLIAKLWLGIFANKQICTFTVVTTM